MCLKTSAEGWYYYSKKGKLLIKKPRRGGIKTITTMKLNATKNIFLKNFTPSEFSPIYNRCYNHRTPSGFNA